MLGSTNKFCKNFDLNCFIRETMKMFRALLRKKAILFLDNCHGSCELEEPLSDDGKIVAKFLPPNVTMLIQPINKECLNL